MGTMTREEYHAIVKSSAWEGSPKPTKNARERRLLAEFDRLTTRIEELEGIVLAKNQYLAELNTDKGKLFAENEELSKSNSILGESLSNTLAREKNLQSWLDRISERLAKGTYPHVAHTINTIRDYLDSQSPEKPEPQKPIPTHLCCLDDSTHDGAKADCPICNPKPTMKQCPECKGKMGHFEFAYRWGRRILLYRPCDNCEGQGVI